MTEQVSEIVWSGSGSQGMIPPGQFLNFPISTEIPGKAGEELTFKVLQYYDNGEVVRWIGPPNSDEPAPQIDVTAEGGPLQDVAGRETAPPSPSGEATTEASESSGSSSSDSASKGLGIAALVIGALGLIAGGAALVRSRRTAGRRAYGTAPGNRADRDGAAAGLALVLAAALAGCSNATAASKAPPAPPRSDFPAAGAGPWRSSTRRARRKRTRRLADRAGLRPGVDRFGFGVFTAGNEQVTDAKVALYFAHGRRWQSARALPGADRSLATQSGLHRRNHRQRLQGGEGRLCGRRAPFHANGEWQVLAMVEEGTSTEATSCQARSSVTSPPSAGLPQEPRESA